MVSREDALLDTSDVPLGLRFGCFDHFKSDRGSEVEMEKPDG